MNNLCSIFPIKSISPFSFMAAKGNDLHQEFCIIFHVIQLYESGSEGWPTYFISTSVQQMLAENLQCVSVTGRTRTVRASSGPREKGGSLAAPLGLGEPFSSRAETRLTLPILPNTPIKWHILPSFEKTEDLNGPISKRLLSL